MKLNYYGYCFRNVKNGKRILMSAQKLFKHFCMYENPKYKNQFEHNGEHVFLLNAVGGLYLFLQTRSNELIKKINSDDITVGEIYDLLNQGEMIGFASYVYVKGSFLGFASTVMAPRAGTFANFVNLMLQSIGVKQYEFTLIPLLYQVTRADVVAMPFLGKSTIQVNKSNSLYDDIRNFAGGTVEEFADVDSFEIVIKPRKRKNIEKAVEKLIEAVPDEGLEKMIVKAKDEIQGALVDLYLAGSGIIADKIDTRDEKVIAQKMKEKIENNPVLKEKVAEYEQDDTYSKETIDGIASFGNADAWTVAFHDL